MMQKIKDEEKNNSQLAMIAHNLTDVCGPRLTNSPGYNRALDWVTKTLTSWGVQNAKREAWGEFGKGWSTEGSYMAMKAPYYESIIAYPVAWTKGTSKNITADVILVDELDSATIDQLGSSIKGKIIMAKNKRPELKSAFTAFASRHEATKLDTLPDDYMFTKEQLDFYMPMIKKAWFTKVYLTKKGAAGLISCSPGRDGTIFVDGTPGYATGYDITLPEMVVAKEDFLKLQRLLEDHQKVQVEMNAQNKFMTTTSPATMQ